MTTLVRKRDGSFQAWDRSKVARAMLCAFHEATPDNIPDVTPYVDVVEEICTTQRTIDIDEIQRHVENTLMESQFHDVARAYITYRSERDRIRLLRQAAPDKDAISEYTTVAKYARYDEDMGRREVYEEICGRVERMHVNKFPEYAAEIHNAFNLVRSKDLLPSMRSFQFAGPAIEKNNVRMYNCSWTLMDRLRAFGEVFYVLLAGCGAGFSVQFQHVAKLPEVQTIDETNVRHWTIEDTIEGWADAVNELIRSYFVSGDYIEFDYSAIRDRGTPLRTSGGLAPGHLPLRRCLDLIRAFLSERSGRRLRPIEVFDICCHLADAVLAGGIRRSSLICIFSIDDYEMMTAKAHGNFVPAGVPGTVPKNNQRQMANISAFCHRMYTTFEQFDRLMRLNRRYGEPGFYWGYDPDFGANPCGEIGMYSVLRKDWSGPDKTLNFDWKYYADEWAWSRDGRLVSSNDDPEERTDHCPCEVYGWNTGIQFCNLCELNGAYCSAETLRDHAEVAAFIGTMQAAYSSFPYLGPVTEAIVKREALLGVGLTGIMDNPDVCLNPEALRVAAEAAVASNRLWAARLGINAAARVTTVKPGGTAPLVLGCVASGITPHHARRYFRRVTANPMEPAAQYLKSLNPQMVEIKPNGDWSIIFCVEAPENAKCLKDLSALEHMDAIFTVYENWIVPGTVHGDHLPLTEIGLEVPLTHNVSCTVVVKEHEWDAVIKHAWDNRHRTTAMAFLPFFGDKTYPFAPRESVTTPADEAKWNMICSGYTPINWRDFREKGDKTQFGAECTGMSCEMR